MNAPNGPTVAERLRRWWFTPPRAGLQRLINPWEYRHIGPFGVTRIAGGSLAAGAGLICLAYGVYGWAAFFLLLGALNLAGGYWYLTIARSRSARA
jgi:hypothetical protein